MKKGLILLFVILLVSFSYGLDACCEKDNNGNWCQYTDEGSCDSSSLMAYTACEQTSYCEVGCCYSSDTGSCYKNTPRATCEAESGTWSDSSACDIEQCAKGCCTIGDQAFFVTEVKCKSVGSGYEEAAVNFDPTIQTESACLESVKNLNMGCCVTDESATFVTRGECSTVTTEVTTNFTAIGFHDGMLCSNELLSTECAKQQSTGCYNGKVYWYDSCGNRENIYSSDERTSYNSGYVLDEVDSCAVSGANDENCGNCDYAMGMICGKDENNIMALGEYTCVDLTCEDTYENDASPISGGDKKNGESWCIYDHSVGEAQDTVGSRHYRHLCINGEEMTESCADYREEICIGGVLGEEVLTTLYALQLDNGDYVEAACRENRNKECSSCNDATLGVSDQKDCCENEDLRDCYWMIVTGNKCEKDNDCELGYVCSGNVCVDEDADEEDVESGICVAQVPQGLKFWDENSDVCNVASTTCTVTKRLSGWKNILRSSQSDPENWKTISESPVGCTDDKEWLVDQNNYCKSLGDCGAYYNFVGDAGFDGFSSTMFDEEFFFNIEDFTEDDIGDWDLIKNSDIDDTWWEGTGWSSSGFLQNYATWAGALSVIAGGLGGVVGDDNKCETKKEKDGEETDEDEEKDNSEARQKLIELIEEANVDEQAKQKTDSAPINPMYTVTQGNNPQQTSSTSTLEQVTSTGNKVKSVSNFFKDTGCFLGSALPLPGKWLKIGTKGPLTTVMNYITIAAAVYLAVEYLNENETTMTYTVTCGNWQPPKGGENCELCNDENKPCSEYRCKSLGAACALVNEGSGNESCIAMNINDVNSPIITPLESVLREQEFTYEEITDQGNPGYEIKEKIKAFTPVTIGIQTDEPAQCKYSTQGALDYDTMASFFGSEIYLYNHTATFSLGSEATSEEIIAATGGVYNVYIRCSDALGNANERDYFIRFTVDNSPDLTPAEIKYTSIDSGSYMPYSVNETGFSLYTNEPAQCKWAMNDTGYEFMDGEMDCASSGFEQSSVYFGTYECSTTLIGVSDDEINSYYFKCSDTAGNVNEDSYVFKTKKTEDPLSIDSVEPNGTIYDDTIELKVETSDGANKGVSLCAFSPNDVDFMSMVVFANTNSSEHTQSLTLSSGEYTYYITCQDVAGNRASDKTTFTIEVDEDAPVIETLYVDEIYETLTVGFGEDVLCERANEQFTYGEGISMNTGSEYETNFDIDFDSLEYYLICEDKHGNFGAYYIDLSTWS